MLYDMTKPCKHCPFRNDETRLTFACRERAEDIEEQAFLQGFPCHVTAEHVEEDDDPIGSGGFYATEDSQMCAGFIAMMLKSQEVWPSLNNNDEDLFAKLEIQYGEFWNLPVFECAEDFFEANK